jgi:dienelactone hydrolase
MVTAWQKRSLFGYPAWVFLMPLVFISPLFVMACCPEGSWGELKRDSDYKDLGTVDLVGDLPVYRVGKSDKFVLWNYDVFGFNGGRTRQLADQLAAKGFTVILPDYYRGKVFDPAWLAAEDKSKLVEFIKNETNAAAFKELWTKTLRPYAEKHGAKTYGAIGTCWGTYPVVVLSSLPEFRAGVSMHPSHNRIMTDMLKDDETAALEAVRGKPQLFLPAGDDTASVKPGGLSEKVLGKDLTIVEFADMKHGWTTGGDLSDTKVEAEVKRAMVEAANFFEKHLK